MANSAFTDYTLKRDPRAAGVGPGGHRFGDYARLGAPLSLIVILVGVPTILFLWPIH
jgi:di/tricarboxylate transporter